LKKIYLFIFIFIPLLSSSQTRVRCGTYESWQQMKQQDPSLVIEEEKVNAELNRWIARHQNNRGTNGVITIPVVVHLLYHEEEENLPDDVIQSQIDVLNIDFARLNQDTLLTPAAFRDEASKTNIRFCLASITPDSVPTNGIERKYTDIAAWQNFNDMKFESSGGLDAWNRNYYMNIWVGNLDGGVLGLTQMPGGPPGTDGMCIYFRAFGRIGDHLDPEYNLGRTVTHETGHWLGLVHTWGDDDGGCSLSDNINDTPNQANHTFGCPLFPRMDACSPTYPGIMFMNYMDYTDDACMNLFTSAQAVRMDAILNTTRASILLNQSCSESIVVSLPIKLFPNPVSDEIMVHTYFNVPASIDFSLKDIFGRELSRQSRSLSSYEKVSFDATTIPSGVYVVTATSGNYSITEKVIVTHR
jgi:hypothetical protein